MPFSRQPARAPAMKITHGASPAPTNPCSVGGGLEDAFLQPAGPGAGLEDHARVAPGADEPVLGVRRAVHEVPGLQPPLLAFDEEDALAGEDEEVLLVGLAMVTAARLPGPDH